MGNFSGGMISGMVLDEDGKPVSSAIVTIWQDGQPWVLNTKLAYNGGNVNPRTSGIYGENEGSFLFGLAAPGSYVITAEKDGYSCSVNVTVENVTINSDSREELDRVTQTVTITLPGYCVPVLSQEQLSYTGGVAGTIKTHWGYGFMGANVSLWQNGQLVVMPGNPQSTHARDVNGSKVDYLFEHLAPGQYQIVVVYGASPVETETAAVNVSDRIEVSDIVLSKVLNRPAPFPGVAAAVLAFGTASMLFIILKRKR